MPPTPFSDLAGGGADNLGELGDVEVDATTLANGHELVYDSVDEKWKNAAGAGGALFAGTANDYLYKDGAVARTGGISNDPASAGKALVVDPAGLRVGIGGKTNPAHSLDVGGSMRVADTHAVTISDETLGVTTSAPLRLFSHNASAAAADRVDLDSSAKTLTVGGTARALDPVAFDAPNGTNSTGLYAFKLQSGTYNQAAGQQPFQQPPAAGIGFPQGIVHPYLNNLPVNTPCIRPPTARRAARTHPGFWAASSRSASTTRRRAFRTSACTIRATCAPRGTPRSTPSRA